MKLVLFDKPGRSTTSVLRPNYAGLYRERGLSESEALAFAINKLPSDTDYALIEEESVPKVRTFRDAWEKVGDSLTINMDKARAIHMERIRSKRDKVLASLDVPFLKALESGDTGTQSDIADLKRTLRDIPRTFDLNRYTSPDELAIAWPVLLTDGD